MTDGVELVMGEREAEIGRTLRHAQNTRRTETDSWRNGYQDDVAYLLARVVSLEGALERIALGMHGREETGLLPNERDPHGLKTDWQLARAVLSGVPEAEVPS